MVYKNNIPIGADRPSLSRGQIQENFSELDSQYGSNGDHVEFSATTNNGKHKRSTYIASADPTTAAGEIALYAKTVSGATELYLRQVSAGSVVQMTRGAPLLAADGYTFLPGNLLLQWGSVNATPGGVVFTFPIAFTSVVYSVTIGGRAAGAQAFSIGTPGLASVLVYSSNGTQACYVQAIGV